MKCAAADHQPPPPLTPHDWVELWQAGTTPWDLGGAHPGTAKLWQEYKRMRLGRLDARSTPGWPQASAAPHVLMPGAGAAHDAVRFLEDGCAVTAYDIAQQARVAAGPLRSRFAQFEYRVGDIFVAELNESPVDIVFDRAVLCAFYPQLRVSYIDYCAHVLSPGGYLLGLPFMRIPAVSATPYGADNYPPFFLTVGELFELMSMQFDLVLMEPWQRILTRAEAYGEYLMIWRKRS